MTAFKPNTCSRESTAEVVFTIKRLKWSIAVSNCTSYVSWHSLRTLIGIPVCSFSAPPPSPPVCFTATDNSHAWKMKIWNLRLSQGHFYGNELFCLHCCQLKPPQRQTSGRPPPPPSIQKVGSCYAWNQDLQPQWGSAQQWRQHQKMRML